MSSDSKKRKRKREPSLSPENNDNLTGCKRRHLNENSTTTKNANALENINNCSSTIANNTTVEKSNNKALAPQISQQLTEKPAWSIPHELPSWLIRDELPVTETEMKSNESSVITRADYKEARDRIWYMRRRVEMIHQDTILQDGEEGIDFTTE
jgi:hypothetical protein